VFELELQNIKVEREVVQLENYSINLTNLANLSNEKPIVIPRIDAYQKKISGIRN